MDKGEGGVDERERQDGQKRKKIRKKRKFC